MSDPARMLDLGSIAGSPARSIVTAPLVAAAGAGDPARVARATRSTRQTRVGKDGELFTIYKLRTMVRGAEFTGAGLAIQEGDERITRIGAFLRRYSLDELPNLWNVLRGEMSIVGPRPTLPVQVEQYTERQRGRLAVKPGHHRLGPGQRPRLAALARADRARPLVRRAPLAAARPADPRADARGWCSAGEGLYKGETGGWIPPTETRDDRRTPDAAVLLTGVGQALRHRLGVRPARHRGRRRSQPARARPVRRAPPRRGAADRRPRVRARRCGRCARSTTSARSCR